MSKFAKLEGQNGIVEESMHEIVAEGFIDTLKDGIKTIGKKLGLIKEEEDPKEKVVSEAQFKKGIDSLLKDKEFRKYVEDAIKIVEDLIKHWERNLTTSEVQYKLNLTPYNEAMKALKNYECEFNKKKGPRAIWILNREPIKDDEYFYPVKFGKYCLICTGKSVKTTDLIIVIDQWNSYAGNKDEVTYNGESLLRGMNVIPSDFKLAEK